MFSEKKENEKSASKPFLIMIIAFVAAILLTEALSRAGLAQAVVSAIRILLVPAAAAGIFYIIKKYMYTYTFVVDAGMLCVYKSIGNREYSLCRIKKAEIRSLVRGEDEVSKILAENAKTVKNDCRVGKDRTKDTVLKYRDFNANKDAFLIFEPSDELFTIISEKLLDNGTEM